MVVLRSTVSEVTMREGKTATVVVVRSASKIGASLGARIASSGIIPIRDQEVREINSLSNTRVLDQWEVTVVDRNDLDSLGQ